MKPEEIFELASRYLDKEDFVTIPTEGELFAFLQRELPDNKVLKENEGWEFGGYAILKSYELDMSAKPVGKWIFMEYLSLAQFPPQLIQMKLQPPHIAKGSFTDPTQTIETRIVSLNQAIEPLDKPDEDNHQETQILSFPKK